MNFLKRLFFISMDEMYGRSIFSFCNILNFYIFFCKKTLVY